MTGLLAKVDYDMFLLDISTGDVVASSTAVQDGSQPPLESITVDIPDGVTSKQYIFIVTKKNGEPAGKELEIMLGGTCCFMPFAAYSSPIATSSSSIFEPADAQSVLTVGAINYANWTTGPQEDFSSQGPTNAWAGSSARIKPDICGPDGTSGYTYGVTSFPGTSAATPHVAGAAALILSMHPQYTVDQLRAAIEQNAVDMGSAGKDNIYGNGRLRVDKSLNTPPVLGWTGEAGYVSDGLEPEAGNSLTPLTFKIKYTDTNGDAPAVHDLYIDRNGDGDYADAGEIISMTAAGSDYKSGVIYTCAANIPYSAGSSNCSYYFNFSDGVDYATGNITSGISTRTAINKPDIFQSLSLAIDRSNWQLPGIPAGSRYATDNSNKIKVTNDGDGPETYSLRIAGEGSGWSAATSKDGADVNKFVLSAIFSDVSTTSVDTSYFNETGNDDVISTAVNKASQTMFGSPRLPAGGFSALPGNDRNLWLEFKAPAKDTIHTTQAISVTLNAETQ
ncbi:MAG: S8 family serine peptidase [Candidatus Omnitrophica bacterium]|nr:S8 family serine peptidase [Candidatus Omnitrophota bacterium]